MNPAAASEPEAAADVVAMRPLRNGDVIPSRSGPVLMRWLLPLVSDEEARAVGMAAEREFLPLAERPIRSFVPRALSLLRGRRVDVRDLSPEEVAALPKWDRHLGRYLAS